jgi:CRP-like cAMP-binding protein
MQPRPKNARSTGNHILDRLPASELDRLLADARWVSFAAKQEVDGLGDAGEPVYFPISGVYSLVLPLRDGARVEVAVVDSEGLLGIPVVLGLATHDVRAVAQVGGDCVRVDPDRFLAVLRTGGVLDALVRRFMAISWQTANQNIACNQRHPVRERTCRWLLSVHDRTATDEFEVTQEEISAMVGASRQKITAVARGLQAAGFITYQRGRVRVVDRSGLEAASCECYAALKRAYRLLTT